MADWASANAKVAPGEKVYLFTGDAGNAIDLLVERACAGVEHRYTVRPPFGPDALAVQLGTPDETQVVIVRDADRAGPGEVRAMAAYLAATKRKGQSLVIVGDPPEHPGIEPVRARAARQGVLVDVADPQGAVGRKNLITWVGEDWRTTTAAATRACERARYRIETLVHARRAFLALSSGQPVEGTLATRLVDIAVPLPPVERAYRLLLARDRDAVHAVAHLDAGQRLALFRALESALTDLELLHPVFTAGLTAKTAAERTGLHLVRALELAEWAPRYPPGVALRCRQVLAFALAHWEQEESASTAAILWS